MSDFAKAYTEIMRAGIVTKPISKSGELCFVLTEDAPNAKLKGLVINNVPPDSILVNLQLVQKEQVVEKLKIVFKEDESLFNLCDYLLIAKEKSLAELYLHFIFIEMKSEKPAPKLVLEQFRGASSFNRYIEALLEYNWNFVAKETYNICTSYTLFSFRNFGGGLKNMEANKLTHKRISQKPSTMNNVKELSARANNTFHFMVLLGRQSQKS